MTGDLSVGKFGYQIQFLKFQLDFIKVESDLLSARSSLIACYLVRAE